jgi:para-aminobenzoate synthetase component 1
MQDQGLIIQSHFSRLRVRRLSQPLNFWACLMAWPDQAPLITFGGRASEFSVLVLAFREVSPYSVWQQRVAQAVPPPSGLPGLPFLGGWVGLNAYEETFSDVSNRQAARSRYFWVSDVLVFDHPTGTVYQVKHDDPGGRPQYAVSLSRWESVWRQTVFQPESYLKNAPLWQWAPEFSAADYLQKAESCLQDIRNGRYYQINLLRFFQLQTQLDHAAWVHRWYQHGGPFASWVRLPDCEVMSFSPERFVRLESNGSTFSIKAEPIKGTVAVAADPVADRQARESLAASEKDRAELHMIVDLMRNDLYRIADQGGVLVEDPGQVHSFTNVHHLIARLRACPRNMLTLGEMWSALCPGGSITGAPKQEVMQAIREYEERPRGYFMGNFFYWSPLSCQLDSSILIRTVQRLGADADYQFAAGSGLVIKSRPSEELAEIQAKARVVVDAEGEPFSG